MRLGVIGGTFDPIHIGHLVIAQEACARLKLDQVLFVPAAQSPLKMDRPITPSHHRLQMVQLATITNPRFAVSRVDVDRPGPSYTVDTIRLLLDYWEHDAEIYFIVGIDSLAELLTWREPALLLDLCRLAVVPRPGYTFDPRDLLPHLPNVLERIVMVPAPALEISSVDLRRRIGEGLPIRYMVPESVEEYIFAHGLYRAEVE